MYDIKQFRPTLLVLLLLSYFGYAVAAQTPGLWFIATVGTLLQAWLQARGSFRPLPRLLANVVTLLCAAWLVLRVRQMPGPPILAIGEFLVFLQLIKLYEQRGNRDIAQLLILSLLLMVAAAISTASLLFGILFVVYLFLSLYCCLLFHLKTETDHAKNVMGVDEGRLNLATLRQDQRFLPRSMRRLTVLVSSVAIVMAVLVFLFFPRGSGAGIIGNFAFKQSQAMTGFSDEVSFQDVARITQNEAEVAYVTVTRNGEAWGGIGETLYLRGSAPDTYISDPNDPNHWKWVRDPHVGMTVPSINGGQEYVLNDVNVNAAGTLRQDIKLLPTGSSVLFAMPGIRSIIPNRDTRVVFNQRDDVLQLQDPLTSEFRYSVFSTGNIAASGPQAPVGDPAYPVPEEIRKFALRPEVSGSDAKGPLGKRRLGMRQISELDTEVARNIESYLLNNYTYSLDLTNVRRNADRDPIVEFLTNFKQGHCEYFAGAMTLLCQGLGMQARMVVGFKCDDFNTLGNYYLVKQSHAHAWVEVLTPNGWEQFDPTASSTNTGGPKSESLWKKLKNVVSYLEYSWGNNVINYDADSRTSLIQSVDAGLTNSSYRTSEYLARVQGWFNLENFYTVSSGLILALVGGMIGIVLLALGYFLYERWRLQRRARRIGLESLPSSAQKRLARQLQFYDALLRSLDRRDLPRSRHMTPLEYSQSMDFLPGDLYDSVQRLTNIVYRVRYGGYELDPGQQRRLMRVVERLDEAFGPAGAKL